MTTEQQPEQSTGKDAEQPNMITATVNDLWGDFKYNSASITSDGLAWLVDTCYNSISTSLLFAIKLLPAFLLLVLLESLFSSYIATFVVALLYGAVLAYYILVAAAGFTVITLDNLIGFQDRLYIALKEAGVIKEVEEDE